MGFVYNTFWEGFTKTYFEMNGYFVLTNLFAALIQPDDILPQITPKDAAAEGDDNTADIHRALEADLVACRYPGTKILYGNDQRGKNRHPAEFFPDEWSHPFVYTEVRANLARNNAAAQIQSLLDDRGNIEKKRRLVAERFSVADENEVLIVVAGFEIQDRHREEIQNRGWKFKTFFPMHRFMADRFSARGDLKLRVQYNDPNLEILRFSERLSRGDSRGKKDGID